jgi:toxin ParE1/3/4
VQLALVAEAEEELDAAVVWYDEQRAGLGDELLAEVHRVFCLLRESPAGWPVWPNAPRLVPPVRRLLVARFPYALAFQVFPDKVVILAVAHTKRQPFYWLRRVR